MKSKSGISTPKEDIDVIKSRLRKAGTSYKEGLIKETRIKTLKDDSVHVSSGNVNSDLDLPNPEKRLAKTNFASIMHEIIEVCGLTQQ